MNTPAVVLVALACFLCACNFPYGSGYHSSSYSDDIAENQRRSDMEKMERRMKEMEAHQSRIDFQRKMDEFDRENREAAERSHARWSAPPPPRYNPYGGTEYSNRSSYRTY